MHMSFSTTNYVNQQRLHYRWNQPYLGRDGFGRCGKDWFMAYFPLLWPCVMYLPRLLYKYQVHDVATPMSVWVGLQVCYVLNI